MKEKTVSLVEQTANRIVEYFEKNDLKVGDKLPNEYTLAQDLEVGRSTLREAVKMLVSKNILEVVCLQILELDGGRILFCTLICDGVMFVLLPNC